jgi:hypothetical protein
MIFQRLTAAANKECCLATEGVDLTGSFAASYNKSFEVWPQHVIRVEEFKYLGPMLTDQNPAQKEIRSRLKLGNACYHSVQNLLSSRLLSKNLKIKTYRNIILPVVL